MSEARRAELVARLRALGSAAQAHPGYKRALKLLNDTFRKSKLAQRLAVLQAAAWLIDVLERVHGRAVDLSVTPRKFRVNRGAKTWLACVLSICFSDLIATIRRLSLSA